MGAPTSDPIGDAIEGRTIEEVRGVLDPVVDNPTVRALGISRLLLEHKVAHYDVLCFVICTLVSHRDQIKTMAGLSEEVVQNAFTHLATHHYTCADQNNLISPEKFLELLNGLPKQEGTGESRTSGAFGETTQPSTINDSSSN